MRFSRALLAGAAALALAHSAAARALLEESAAAPAPQPLAEGTGGLTADAEEAPSAAAEPSTAAQLAAVSGERRGKTLSIHPSTSLSIPISFPSPSIRLPLSFS